MTRSRRPWSACAATSALLLALSGCSLLEDGDDGGGQVETVALPSEVPVTFESRARWDAGLVPGTRPVELDEGLAILQPGPGESTYRVALISTQSGKRKWTSKVYTNPTPDKAPQLTEATVDGKSWVLVETQTGENEVTLDAYAAEGTGDRREPHSSGAFVGVEAETSPEVTVGEEGIVVHYSSNPEYSEWQKEVRERKKAHQTKRKEASKKQRKKMSSEPWLPDKPKGPASGSMTFAPAKGATTVYDGPGTIRSVWSEGIVVTNPSGKSGFGFVVGEKPAWESADVRPASADYKSSGSLLAEGEGVLVGQWPGKDGKPLLAVHDVRTGRVIATLDELSAQAVAAAEGSKVVASNDGRWVSWGSFVFALKSEESDGSAQVALNHGDVSAIHEDVLYVQGAQQPLTASSVKATPASTADEKVEEEADSEHRGMVDISSGNPLTNTKPEAVPLFVSSASQGVFVLPKDGETRLYSVALS